ncbi:DUF1697 domain-containing protein [Arsenicicoccus piscis]|uniref:DUF1697 domain-containing protein n=1 Tax=Arsenicicoccus piscis TaxID=673954 RepID=A0ABQ6HTN7_9MICO|nr:DUF1697 domain-containing protein [Arsenicicoccus piscis]GMA21762.1 hypothetical protein GCM10025862_37830 [Arsenicicoccus piscis]
MTGRVVLQWLMTTHVVLLRGINLGKTNRVPMARLRQVLTDAGCTRVRTLIASGNVVLDHPGKPDAVSALVHDAIADEWGLDIPALTRTAASLRKVLAHNPIDGADQDPKHYAVTFLSTPAPAATLEPLGLDADPSPFPGEHAVLTRGELYTWTPEGIHKSRLLRALGRLPALHGTARNWDTVRRLADLAEEGD